MANTNVINKVIYDGNVLIDLTADTISADKVLSPYTFHDKSGTILTGTCSYDSDTSEDTAAVAEILSGKTAHARGTKLIGTMPNNGAVSGTISTVAGTYTITQGYHDGSGKVGIDTTEQAKIVASNIKSGINILGVTGTYTGEAITAQTKTVIPKSTDQTITADQDYDYLAEVLVKAVPYVETLNSAGGYTATIG